jgi:hypothetical protein
VAVPALDISERLTQKKVPDCTIGSIGLGQARGRILALHIASCALRIALAHLHHLQLNLSLAVRPDKRTAMSQTKSQVVPQSSAGALNQRGSDCQDKSTWYMLRVSACAKHCIY